MKAQLRASLEQTLNEWIENEAEHDERPDGYVYDGLAKDMRRAAEAVYDAAFSVQEWVKGNT